MSNRLIEHLKILERSGVIALWHRGNIPPGTTAELEASQQLERAHVVVPLISASYLASRRICDSELDRALERQRLGDVIVMPVLLRPCAWECAAYPTLKTVLPSGLRAVSMWPDRDEPLTQITREIRKAALSISIDVLG